MTRNPLIIVITSIITILVVAGCEKEYLLSTNPAGPNVVIQGLVTNQPGYHYVKLTRSAGFYDSGNTPRIIDATVSVEDDLGNVTEFAHNPGNNPDSTGYYKPVTAFAGEIGRTYRLSVMADGQLFEAEDTMYPVTSIDSLTYGIDEEEQEDPEHPGRYFEVLIYTREPQETKDYYLFNFYRNDSLTIDNPTDIYFTDDVVLSESINGITAPIYYSKGDKAAIEAFSLSRNAFVFYNDLSILLNNDGGMYSPPPANCRTNLTNGALGFFQTSAVTAMDIAVE
jgi:hypothetical protein